MRSHQRRREGLGLPQEQTTAATMNTTTKIQGFFELEEQDGMTGSAQTEKDFSLFLDALQKRVGDAKFKSWFSDLDLMERSLQCVTLSTESQAKCELLDSRYLAIMADTWRNAIGPIAKMRLTTRRKLSASAAKVSALPNAQTLNAKQQAAAKNPFTKQVDKALSSASDEIAAPLDPRRVFKFYAVGDGNLLAWTAARQTLDPSIPRELLYLYGKSGVGKTHLAQAVAAAFQEQQPDAHVAYIPYRNMINACVPAALNHKTKELHDKLMSYDLLVFDDIHFFQGKDRTQEELLVAIDAALDRGKQVVVAGDMAPSKLADAGLNKRLADRLAGGLPTPIHDGDEALRLAILKKRLHHSAARCTLEDGVLEFIARTFSHSTRETIGALNQLLLLYAGEEHTVTLENAKAILKSRISDRRKTVTLEDAIAAGAEAFALTQADILGRTQPQRIVRGRHAIVWCAREVLKESFPRIGKALGRDHTTVMSSYRRAQALLERDKNFSDRVTRIREALED